MNPRKRAPLAAVAAVAGLILLGGGIGIGAAAFGGNDHSPGWMMYERNGYRGFPGSAPFPGERGRPGHGVPWHMPRRFAPPAQHPKQGARPAAPRGPAQPRTPR